MPSILYTNSATSSHSPLPTTTSAPSARKPKGRSMQSLHSSRQNPRYGSAVPRHVRYSASMQQGPPTLKAFPTPTLDTISSTTSTSSTPALKSTPTVSSSTGMPSVWSSTVSVSSNSPPTRTSSGSQSTTSTTASSKPQVLAVKAKTDSDSTMDSYRLRYAKYLASQFNMSMDAAMGEADFQLNAAKKEAGQGGNGRSRAVRHSGFSEAEVMRDGEWSS